MLHAESIIQQDCRVVPGGNIVKGSIEGRTTVPQETKVAAGAEENVQEQVQGDENGQSGVQRGMSAVRLMQ